jgi:hypothetical protein
MTYRAKGTGMVDNEVDYGSSLEHGPSAVYHYGNHDAQWCLEWLSVLSTEHTESLPSQLSPSRDSPQLCP